MDDTQRKEIQKMIDESIRKALHFSTRKLGDTPTDGYQLTPEKYVNLNGLIANRPRASVASMGQQYYPIDINYPVFFNGNSSVWVSATGSTVAGG